LSQLAVSYGANAVPAMGGTTDSSRIKFQNAAVPAIGSGYALTAETVVDKHIGCAGVTKVGEPCKARKANGTDWCVGHLRSRGEL
jgi:hypothetical protein